MGRPDYIDSGGNTVELTYDEVGNCLNVKDDAAHYTVYTYDYNNQLTLITDASSKKLAYQYDSVGRLTKTGGGSGATVAPTSFAYSTTTYSYANNNELVSMTDYNGTLSFGYDELGRMTSKSRGSDSATYAYHYVDRLTKVDSDFPGEGLVTAARAGPG